MTESDEKDLLRMTREIYHHLGLDGAKIISMRESREQVERDVLKFREKRLKRSNERAASRG